MTNYRLYPTNPTLGTASYSGIFEAGISFWVTQGGMWLQGFWWFVPAGGGTAAQKFTLWNVTGSTTGVVVGGTTVTSGVLTANSWNFISLSSPVPLGIGMVYMAATAWNTSGAEGGIFPVNNSQFGGVGQPFHSGITNGPLFAFSDGTSGGAAGTTNPWSVPQGTFAVTSTDPTAHMPAQGSNSANFAIDLQVTDTGPAGYTGPYQLWPTTVTVNSASVPDAAVNYVIATEFKLSQACTIVGIRYYSPAGTIQLATRASIWRISDQTEVLAIISPSWSGAAGSGWIQANFGAGVTLPAGDYKVSVFNSAATPDQWSAKDANSNYWDTGIGANGITWGPLTAPGLATAATSNFFPGPGTGPGQSTFENPSGGPNQYPDLYVTGLAQNYWVDVVVNAGVVHTATASLTVTPVLAVAATHAHFRSVSAAVTPARAVAATHTQFRTADLTVTPVLAETARHVQVRTASLTVNPVLAAITHVHKTSGALTVTPAFSVHTQHAVVNLMFRATAARTRWLVQGGRIS